MKQKIFSVLFKTSCAVFAGLLVAYYVLVTL